MKKDKFYAIFVLQVLCFLNISSGFTQKLDSIITPELKDLIEYPDDEYIPIAREGRASGPSYNYSNGNFSMVQVNVNELGENIIGDAANEPSIAIDPTNPNRMVIGWRQFDTIESNFRQAGFAYSNDGGQNWTFPGVIEPGVFRSDPVLDFDSEGNFYYNSLGTDNGFRCTVFKSTGDGTWDAGTLAFGGDKQWMVIDRTGGQGHGNIYSFWAQSFSICTPGFFTRSWDGGFTYEECNVIPNPLRRGTLSVGPDGALYACGQVGTEFYVAKSTNAQDSTQTLTWDFTSNVFLDGELERAAGPNPAGMLGQVWIATDHSGTSTHGNVYLLCSVKRFSTPDVLDVMFARSTDGGLTWSTPIRINDDNDPTAWQWFGTLSVAPNGRIDVAWVDTRDDPGGFGSALYISHSEDGGLTWSANERLSESFDPLLGFPSQNKIGDYYEMISDEGGAHLTWAATFNGEQDVYYSYIPYEVVAIEEVSLNTKAVLYQNHPNPFSESTQIDYQIKEAAFVELEIFNALGEKVKTLAESHHQPGEYTVDWDGKAAYNGRTPAGLYYYSLKVDGLLLESKKLIIF